MVISFGAAMNVMKVYYFNDTKNDQTIFLKDTFMANYIIKPAEGRLFQFDAPKDTIPFIKIWHYDHVLISYMREPKDIDQID